MEPAYIALTLYVLWTLFWLITSAGLRFYEIYKGNLIASLNPPLKDNVPHLLKRVARVHGNCLENLPLFATIVFIGSVSGNMGIVNNGVWVFVAARACQSLVHACSISMKMSLTRGFFFLVQIGLMVMWSVQILLGFIV